MLCQACQHENPEQARFCNACGEALVAICTSCSQHNPTGSRFCNGCGASLTTPATPPSESPPEPDEGTGERILDATDPRAYTPRHLADRILTQKSALEGERKHVTVLFADLVDSSELARRVGDPEEMHSLLDRAFRLMLAEVHRVEGTINQFTGDGVMALFGAPLALEDAPRRAVLAALAMQRVLSGLDAEVRERFDRRFQMRIGLHTGPVVVGSIGDDLRMDYTAVGDTTNLAARLESLAGPGQVVISDATARLVEGFFELTRLPPADLKGQPDGVQAHRVEQALAVEGRVDALRARDEGLTAYVGRERELDLLDGAFEQAKAGHGQIAFLVGEAGLGKSRLLHEFRQGLLERGERVQWLEGRCASYAQATPFHAVADLVRRLHGIDDRDDEAAALAKIAERQKLFGSEMEWTLPYLRTLLSLPSLDARVDAMDPMSRRSEMCRALHQRLLRATELAPEVIVIEDLHWVDAATEEFLSFVADTLAAIPVLLILTHRPGYEHALGDRSYHTRITLRPLTDEAMTSMVGSVLSASDLPAPLRELIARKAEGNPLFVEEVTTSLLEEGVLGLHEGRVALNRELAEVSVPDRIQDVLMARLDRLPPEPKRAIQIASIIGREFAMRLLQRIHETASGLDEIVGELRALELIYEKSAHPELAYMFKHALTHEVAYESVLVARRKALHRLVGVAIQELYPDRLAEHYEALAHHFDSSEDWDKALHYYELAAAKSADAYANKAAAEHSERALEIAARLGDVAAERLVVLHERIGACCWMLSDFRRSGDGFRGAAEASSEPEAVSLYWARAAFSYLWDHDYELASQCQARAMEVDTAGRPSAGHAFALITQDEHRLILGEDLVMDDRCLQALAIAEEAGDVEVLVSTLGHSTQRAEWRGEYRDAISFGERALRLAEEAGRPGSALFSSWFQSIASGCLGEYAQAIGRLRSGVALCDRIGDRAIQSRLLNTLGWVYGEIGAHELAVGYNRAATEIAREAVELGLIAGAPELYANGAINLASNLIALGRLDEAAEQLEGVQAQHETDPDPWMRWRWSTHLFHHQALLALVRGELDRAHELSRRDLEAAAASRARKLVCRAHELAGRILLVRDEAELAEPALGEALQIASELGHPTVARRAESLLALLAERRGEGSRADEMRARMRASLRQLATPLSEAPLRDALLASGEKAIAEPLLAPR